MPRLPKRLALVARLRHAGSLDPSERVEWSAQPRPGWGGIRVEPTLASSDTGRPALHLMAERGRSEPFALELVQLPTGSRGGQLLIDFARLGRLERDQDVLRFAASDQDILRFALRYGALELCVHGYVVGRCRARPLRGGRRATCRELAITQPTSWCCAYAYQVLTVLEFADAVQDGKPVSLGQWREVIDDVDAPAPFVDDVWEWIDARVTDWLTDGVRIGFTSPRGYELEPKQRVRPPATQKETGGTERRLPRLEWISSGLVGAIATELVTFLTQTAPPVACNGCGDLILGTRARRRANGANWCSKPECRRARNTYYIAEHRRRLRTLRAHLKKPSSGPQERPPKAARSDR